MRILILGAGKMGSFFTDLLSFNHDVAVLEKDPRRMRFIYNAQRFTSPEEIADFRPELLINCVTLNATLQAFEEVFPYLPKECIISDIASVKTGLQEFYEKSGFRYVSTHPMFGPTFANLGNLQTENAIIIKESDYRHCQNDDGHGHPYGNFAVHSVSSPSSDQKHQDDTAQYRQQEHSCQNQTAHPKDTLAFLLVHFALWPPLTPRLQLQLYYLIGI